MTGEWMTFLTIFLSDHFKDISWRPDVWMQDKEKVKDLDTADITENVGNVVTFPVIMLT